MGFLILKAPKTKRLTTAMVKITPESKKKPHHENQIQKRDRRPAKRDQNGVSSSISEKGRMEKSTAPGNQNSVRIATTAYAL